MPNKKKKLEIYTNGDNDQPTTCPKCISRTDFVELSNNTQKHTCLNVNCKEEFILELD